MTNWEKYFGTPEKTAEMWVSPPPLMTWRLGVSHMPDHYSVSDMYVSFESRDEYIEWLREECDD